MVRTTGQTHVRKAGGATRRRTAAVEYPMGAPWESPSVEDLARRQRVKPLHSLADLEVAGLQNESIEDLLAVLREIRDN